MSTVSIDFTLLANENPYTPPVDWVSVGQVPFQILSGAATGTGASNAILIYNRVQTGLLTSSVVLGTISASESRGVAFCDTSGNGYVLLVRSVDARLFKVAAGVLGSQVGTTYSGSFSINDVVLGALNTATGAFVFSKNGTQFATFTDTTYGVGLRAGINARSTLGYIKSVSVSDYVLQSVTSINGGSPITASQSTVSAVTTGFTGLPTSITATYSGGSLAITGITGTTNAPTFTKLVRVDGQPFPKDNTSVLFTFINGSETASGSETITKDATEVALTVSGGITSDPATWTYWLTQDGFTVEGGELVYDPYGDLVLTADGGGSATDAGTFTSWWRPATGTGAGNVYAYTWAVSEAGIQPASGLTSSGLTSSGLTRVGLTSAGL